MAKKQNNKKKQFDLNFARSNIFKASKWELSTLSFRFYRKYTHVLRVDSIPNGEPFKRKFSTQFRFGRKPNNNAGHTSRANELLVFFLYFSLKQIHFFDARHDLFTIKNSTLDWLLFRLSACCFSRSKVTHCESKARKTKKDDLIRSISFSSDRLGLPRLASTRNNVKTKSLRQLSDQQLNFKWD